LSEAYTELVADPGRLRVLLHDFTLGTDPMVGASARDVLGRTYELYRSRTGGSLEEGRDFVAQGMLINILLSVEGPRCAGDGSAFDALVGSCLPASPEGRQGTGPGTGGRGLG
jgi:hypothetical protein